ncbi:MAG: HAMP domain-containing protein, partial [Acidimicrobiales bacterium]|nr:HAMP domain-containing protein [Acidimicrobiales bacterium]
MIVTLGLLVIVLAVVVTAVTLAYQARLQDDLRSRLNAAGAAVARSGAASSATGLARGLALEGIATTIQRSSPPGPVGKPTTPRVIKPGSEIVSTGDLLVLREELPDGTTVSYSASQGEIGRSIRSLLFLEVIVGLAALAVVAGLVWRGTKVALRPLSEVSTTASAIAEGERERRLRPDRPETELGAMAAAFDHMVDSLDDAALVAQRSEQRMQSFLADAAHELRTPIAALQATAERLLREQPERPERDEVEASLAASASRLGRLVADLLDLARLEAADTPRVEIVDLETIARTVATDTSVNGVPEIRLCIVPATVRGDASGITRAVRNLLDNAMAAIPPTGHITLTVQPYPSGAQVNVSDDGPGVAPAARERIFERFTRMQSGSDQGTGLGLAIAQRIARQ